MKKLEKILLYSITICICLALGFFAYKHYILDKENIVMNDNSEEITLGDSGTCKKTGSASYCSYIGCSSMSENSCKSNSVCCTWSSGGTSTPKPTATPKPTSTPTPTAAAQSCSGTVCCVSGKNNYNVSVCQDPKIPKICGTCPVDDRKCCTSCGKDKNCQNNCKDCGCPAGKKQIEKNGVLTCTSCSSGFFSPAGDKNCYYCNGTVTADGGDCNLCQGANTYMEDGKCKTCDNGVIGKDASGKVVCNKCKITITPQGVVGPSSDNNGKLIGKWTAENCPTNKVSIKISVTGATINSEKKSSGDEGSIRAKNLRDCASVSMSVSWGSVSDSKTIKVTSKWIDQEDGTFEKRPEYREEKADENGDSVMATLGNCETIQGDDGPYTYCKKYKERGCTEWPSTPVYSYCCVDNGIPGLSKNVFYVEGVKTKNCAEYAAKKGYPEVNYTLLDKYDKNKCKAPDKIVGMCSSSSSTPEKQEKQAPECESRVDMTISEGVKCSNDSSVTGFYKIDCDRYVKTNFDYGNDGKKDTDITLFKGEGINFGIDVESSIKCTYEFDNEKWKNVYNSALSRIKNVDSKLGDYVTSNNENEWEKYINNTILKIKGVKTAKLLYEWWNIIKDLKNQVKYYNEYKPEGFKENEAAIVSINTKENGEKVTKNYSFTSIITDGGKFTKTNSVKKPLGVKGVDDPYSYKTSSTSNPTKVVLIPKKVCVNMTTGEVVSTTSSGTCPKNSIIGGNKMYIGYNTDVTKNKETYSINITVTGLGNNDSSVINNKCTFKVVEPKIIYRPIDISNPFINDSWEKGINWVNNLYDFTKVIHSTTWSETTYKKIELSSREIAEIKESNSSKRASSPYLGLCDRIDSSTQDAITRKLCSLLD